MKVDVAPTNRMFTEGDMVSHVVWHKGSLFYVIGFCPILLLDYLLQILNKLLVPVKLLLRSKLKSSLFWIDWSATPNWSSSLFISMYILADVMPFSCIVYCSYAKFKCKAQLIWLTCALFSLVLSQFSQRLWKPPYLCTHLIILRPLHLSVKRCFLFIHLHSFNVLYFPLPLAKSRSSIDVFSLLSLTPTTCNYS